MTKSSFKQGETLVMSVCRVARGLFQDRPQSYTYDAGGGCQIFDVDPMVDAVVTALGLEDASDLVEKIVREYVQEITTP